MPFTSLNTVEEAADLIREQLAELDTDRARLERALESLEGKATARRRGRPRSGSRRRRRSETRAEQAIEMVRSSPGISASEIATRLAIKPNYLYKVLSDLERDGRVRKNGRAYHPAARATSAAVTGAD